MKQGHFPFLTVSVSRNGLETSEDNWNLYNLTLIILKAERNKVYFKGPRKEKFMLNKCGILKTLEAVFLLVIYVKLYQMCVLWRGPIAFYQSEWSRTTDLADLLAKGLGFCIDSMPSSAQQIIYGKSNHLPN